ncbi:hypothetical protein DRH27_02915 [Candidatus Falkowbacteria bacterium]|nr:MAG: hypothetical protein DRH27_02915 [Candidatus Falkowbacteria bacterium]
MERRVCKVKVFGLFGDLKLCPFFRNNTRHEEPRSGQYPGRRKPFLEGRPRNPGRFWRSNKR